MTNTMRKSRFVSSVSSVALVLCASLAGAAEVRLRSEICTLKPILCLGDLAEISGADPQAIGKLGAAELTTAPPPGGKRSISLREIQDALELQGFSLAECQFSGADHVLVTAGSAAQLSAGSYANSLRPVRKATAADRRPARVLVQQAQRLVEEAILRRLQQDGGDSETWQVSAELDDNQVPTVVAAIDTIVADGSPVVAGTWLGRQEFDLTILTADGSTRLRVAARISLPPAIVVTVRDVLKGNIVRECDVELVRLKPGQSPGQAYQTIADVAGKEALRSLPPGQPLDKNLIRAPLLVYSGEVVTVVGRNSSIVVRMPARARESGSRGDLVTVESLLDRKTFLARVSELHEVEVFAGASTASSGTPSRQGPAAASSPGFVRQASADLP